LDRLRVHNAQYCASKIAHQTLDRLRVCDAQHCTHQKLRHKLWPFENTRRPLVLVADKTESYEYSPWCTLLSTCLHYGYDLISKVTQYLRLAHLLLTCMSVFNLRVSTFLWGLNEFAGDEAGVNEPPLASDEAVGAA